MKKYKSLFENTDVTFTQINKILFKYGYKLFKNKRDDLHYVTNINDKSPYLKRETIEFHIPQDENIYPVKYILEDLASKLLDGYYDYRDEEIEKVKNIITDMTKNYHIDSYYTKEINKWK